MASFHEQEVIGFQAELGKIRGRVIAIENELKLRKVWGGVVVGLLLLGGVLALLLHKSYKEEG